MSNRKQKTKEELRRYDIFKGIVAALIAILLLISIATGAVDPDDIASLGSGAETAVEPTAEAAADLEISAPELLSPAPGSELTAGPVPFSGIGTRGSQVAIVAGSQDLGRTDVTDDGAWELVVEMSPEIDEVVLNALDSDDNIAATSPAITFTVIDSAEQADEAAADIFTADPLTETAGAMMVTVSGTGQPGYRVAVSINSEEAAETEINDEGAWSVDVDSSEESAEVNADLISPEGEVIETIAVGQIEGVEVVPLEIDAPQDDVLAGSVTLTGTAQPGATLQLYANGADIGTAVAGDDGTWSMETTLPADEYEIEVVAVDEEGSDTDRVTTVTLSVSEPQAPEVAASQLPLPAFSALTGSLAWEGSADPDSRVAIIVDGEPLDAVTSGDDGQWQLNISLEPGAHDVAFGRVDEEGSVIAQSETATVEIPEQLPQIDLPDFALPDDLLALAGQEAQTGEAGGGAAGEAADLDAFLAGIDLDEIDFSNIMLPAGLLEWEGSAEPGSEVAILVDGEVVDTTTVAAEGGFTLSSDLADGSHTIQLGLVGEDGELTGQSREIPLSVAGLELPTIELPELSGEESPVTVSGTAEQGSTVEITADGENVGETTADESGRWSFDFDLLPDGTNLRAQIVGEDGSPLLQSVPLLLTGFGTRAIAGGDEETPAEGAAEDTVSGAVTYNESIALPDDAVLTIQIEDVSKQDAPATVIGEQIIETDGQQVPFPYEVAYDPAEIDERFTYGMRARIEDGDGNLLFTNDTAIPVITNGNPTEDVAIPTVQVGAADSAAESEDEASITGTVSYTEEIALPDDAVVTVQIQDISTPGASATVIGEQVIESDGQQVPIPYRVTYDPADIEENHTYSAAARIEDSSGNLLFINDTAIPVITNGSPTEEVQIDTVKVDTAVSDVVLDETDDVIGEDGQSAVEAIEGSDSFSQLLEGLQAAGLTQMLEDVEGEYTLFAPTDEAFASVPPQLVAGWDENPQAYEDLLRHLVVEGKYPLDDLTDGQVLTSLAGKPIEITRDGDVVYANGVPVVDSAEVGNSIVYAMPQIILPVFGDGESLPIIDESGVPTFVGPLLTVVGLGEPGTKILLTVDEEPFGEIATVEPNGFWLVKQDISSGVHYILAYMQDDQGLLLGISQEVVLPVP